MMKLRVAAVASSEETRVKLYKQLQALSFVTFDGILMELSDAQTVWQTQRPDVLIVDMTGRETDACLFIEAINYQVDSKTVVFGLHRDLDPMVLQQAVSSGVREFIQYPHDTDALVKAVEKFWIFHQKRVQQETLQTTHQQGGLITVFGCKGGSGASTVVVNLAHQLVALARKRVVILDMDQIFGNTAIMMNFKSSFALSDLPSANPGDIDDNLLGKIVVRHQDTGVDLVVACKNVMDQNPLVPLELIKRVVTYLRANYDYILVDLPSHVVDHYHQYFVDTADEVLLVASLDIPSLFRSRQYLDLLKRHVEMAKVKLLVNRYDLKGTMGMASEAIEEEYRYPVFHRLPNDWELNVEAMSLGKVLAHVDAERELVKAYESLAAKMAGIALPRGNVVQASFLTRNNLRGRAARRFIPEFGF